MKNNTRQPLPMTQEDQRKWYDDPKWVGIVRPEESMFPELLAKANAFLSQLDPAKLPWNRS